MSVISLQDAQARLPELINQLKPGEEITIVRDQTPIARLTAEAKPTRTPRKPGNCQGMMTIVAEDEEHLRDFAEFME